MKYKIDYEGLKEYLESKSEKDFESMDVDHRNIGAEIKLAETMQEIEHCEMDKSKITLDRVIFYGMPFLMDCIGNDLSVIQLTKREYKNPEGRLIHGKFLQTIIPDCKKTYGIKLGGYWVIPEQFLTKR